MRNAIYTICRTLCLDDAPRVITAPVVEELALENFGKIDYRTALRITKRLAADGMIKKLRQGLYINVSCPEPATEADAAASIRAGAVVSLHTVLGDAGVLNNFTNDVYSVIPYTDHENPPSLRTVVADTGVKYLFSTIPAKRMLAPDADDIFDRSFSYPRATPEVALCHWLYLSASMNSSFTKLPQDVDLEELDEERLERIADAMGIMDAYRDWRESGILDQDREYSTILSL